MRFLDGFQPLMADYDGYIVDLWGVIHDGLTPFPGAKETLAALRDAGKRVVLLSNAPRPSHSAQSALRGMGLADDLYSGIMTSGEATRLALSNPPDAWFANLGRRVLHVGPERDRVTLEGLGLERVDSPEAADFMLNTGPDEMQSIDLADYEAVLQASRAAGLKMVCANPDLEIVRGGERVPCAGALALRYEALGGDVRSFGKPDPAIYRPVLEMLGVEKSRVLAVGDALRTDIAGAKAAGVDSCWVLGGIHAEELGSNPVLIRHAAQAAGLAPTACIAAFNL
ncbi:MAG: TIGR01459 family HAD-type hydrolase [Acetobacteraceae bacterium]|nr:TIGR01459 family HAD-type hydrolase [Acetobacteraceae bacterium]